MPGKKGICTNPNFYKHGKEHPAYTTGAGMDQYYRKESIRMFGYNCQICGASKRVNLHHKDFNHKNNPNDGSNWQRLCNTCHRYIHAYGCIPENPEQYRKELQKKRKEDAEKKRQMRIKKEIPYGYITSSEAQNILGVSRQRLHQLIERLPHKRIGNRRGQLIWLKCELLRHKQNQEIKKRYNYAIGA